MTFVVQIKGTRNWPAQRTAKLVALNEAKASLETMCIALDAPIGSVLWKLESLGLEYKGPVKPKLAPVASVMPAKAKGKLVHKDGSPVNYQKPPGKNDAYNRSWRG